MDAVGVDGCEPEEASLVLARAMAIGSIWSRMSREMVSMCWTRAVLCQSKLEWSTALWRAANKRGCGEELDEQTIAVYVLLSRPSTSAKVLQ